MTHEFMNRQQQQAVLFTFVRYEDYYIEDKGWDDEFGPIRYSVICGKGNRISVTPEYVDKNNLLLSMLSLAQAILPKYSMDPIDMFNQPFHEEDRALIIDWCREFGLPLIYGDMDSSDSIGADRFLEGLDDIYRTFQLWARTEFDDIGIDNEYRNNKLEDCIQLFRTVHTAEAHLFIDYKGGIPQLSFSCYSLFDLAKVQLLFQIASRESGTVYKCEECHMFFIRTHGSRTLCDTCRPIRYRRSRRNKKEATNNASEE